MIRQGDVVMIDFGVPLGSEPGYERPSVIVQRDELNASRLGTILVVPFTSNLNAALAMGNVRLRKGEANLRVPSVAQACHVTAVDRSRIGKPIGRLSDARFAEVLAGVIFVMQSPRRPS